MQTHTPTDSAQETRGGAMPKPKPPSPRRVKRGGVIVGRSCGRIGAPDGEAGGGSVPTRSDGLALTPAEFGAEVTRLRLARGWTQSQAGAALGMGKASLCLIEQGRTKARPYVVAGFRAILGGVNEITRAEAP